MNIKKYIRIWLRTTFLSLQRQLIHRGASLIFIIGKLIRFSFFIFSLNGALKKARKKAWQD